MNYQQYTYSLIDENTHQDIPLYSTRSIYSCNCHCCCQNYNYCPCRCHKGNYYENVEKIRSAEKIRIDMNYAQSTRPLYRDKSSIQLNSSTKFVPKYSSTIKSSQSATNIIKKEPNHVTTNLALPKKEEEEKVMDNLKEEKEEEKIEENVKDMNIEIELKNKEDCKDELSNGNNSNSTKDKRENSQKIKYDLENFNQELLALKRKLVNGKKSIPKYPNSAKMSTNNTNSSLSLDYKNKNPNEARKNKKITKKDKNSFNSSNYSLSFGNRNNCFKNQSTIDNDLAIIELNRKIHKLNDEINQYKDEKSSYNIKTKKDLEFFENEIKARDTLIHKQNKELSRLNEELKKSKEHIHSLIKRLSLCQNALNKLKNEQLNNKRSVENSNNNLILIQRMPFVDQEISNHQEMSFIGQPSKKTLTKTIISTTSVTKNKKLLSNSSSTSRLVNKLNINSDLSISDVSTQKPKPSLSSNLIYKIYSNPKSILCYDISSNYFHLFNYADYSNFEENYTDNQNNGSIYITFNSTLYIVTGKNNDMFYNYNQSNNSMNKLCSLNNNHRYGALISYGNNHLICLSGSHNKKVEIFTIDKNNWENLPEMCIERSEFTACIIKKRFIFSIFGFNALKNEYLNTIEYLDIESAKENNCWRYLKYKNENLESMYIKGHLGINYNDEKVIIVGGVNGESNAPEENFVQLLIGNNFEDLKVEKVQRKLKDIYKNTSYMFSSGFTDFEDDMDRKYNAAFDDDDHVHIFEIGNMAHDIFYFE